MSLTPGAIDGGPAGPAAGTTDGAIVDDPCEACGHSGPFERFELREMLFGSREMFPYRRCGSCGLLRIEHVPGDLARHYPLSLTSNTGKTPGRALLKVLDTLNIRVPFTHFIFSDEARYLKPDTGIWQLLVDTNELKPEEIVHVGDSYRMDYKGARAAGLQAILFGRQESLPTETLAIASLSELATTIEEMNR